MVSRILMLSLLVRLAVAQPSPSPSPTTDPWKLGGDIRLRSELDTHRPGKPERERGRVRLRLRAAGGLSPEVKAGFQVRTGAPDVPVQANYSFYNSLGEKEAFGVILDTAYLRATPEAGEPFTLCAGKSPQQFTSQSPLGKLLWDTDYFPPGLWLGWLERDQEVTAGAYVLEKVGRAQVEMVESRQKFALSESSNLVLELELNHFQHIDGPGALALNRGNATVDRNGDGLPDAFQSGFTLLNPTLIYNDRLGDVPLQLTGHYIRNLSASSRNQAYALGFTVGPSQEPGDVSGTYRWQSVDQDALFTPVAQDDLPLTSNFQGHVVGLRTVLAPATLLDLWLLTAAPKTPLGPAQLRFRVDLGWSF